MKNRKTSQKAEKKNYVEKKSLLEFLRSHGIGSCVKNAILMTTRRDIIAPHTITQIVTMDGVELGGWR